MRQLMPVENAATSASSVGATAGCAPSSSARFRARGRPKSDIVVGGIAEQRGTSARSGANENSGAAKSALDVGIAEVTNGAGCRARPHVL